MEDTDNQSHTMQPTHPTQSVIDAPVGTRRNRKTGKPVLVIIIVILILAGLGAGAWYLLREPEIETDSTIGNSLSTPETMRITSTPSPTPTITEINREDLSVSVLNGTGIPGEAGFLETKLEALGYSEIEVGNAPSQDNEITIITFSSDLPEATTVEITKDIESLYETVTTKKSSSLDVDFEVITGLRAGQSLDDDNDTSPTPTKSAGTLTPTGTITVTSTPTPTP